MNRHATLAPPPQPRFLMCPPRHFAVTYSINPWMDPKAWADGGDTLHAVAPRQWAALHRALIEAGAAIETLEPEPGLPDLVFTANAAVVLDGKALLARFRHAERQASSRCSRRRSARSPRAASIGEVVEMPRRRHPRRRRRLPVGPPPRAVLDGLRLPLGRGGGAVVERTFGVGCVALALADPSFYHLDTAFCALPCGGVIYYPGAFTPAAREIIEWLVAPSQRIALEPDDAARFSANAVSLGNVVIMSGASERLAQALAERGYVLVTTPLDAFLKSGGSACCLTLRLDQGLQAAREAAPAHRAAAGEAG